MFAFRLKALESCFADKDTLAVWEISALFGGAIKPEGLEIDRESALAAYIESGNLGEDVELYRAEPQVAEDEMLEVFSEGLIRMVRVRMEALGDEYPLVLDEHGNLEPKSLDNITSVGAAYLGLQFYRIWSAGSLENIEEDQEKRKGESRRINSWFAKLFEMLGSYAVSGHHLGVPHVMANCRSSKTLHRMLTAMCLRAGAGRAKRYEDWTIVQRASNDGGVDCIVHRGGPGMPGHASLVLVGITVQNSQIDRKIVGEDSKRRFSDYFSERPAAFQGALVRHVDADPLTAEKCRNRDCLLYTYDDIWMNIGRRVQDAASRRHFCRIDRAVRSIVREFSGVVLMSEFERYELRLAKP